MEAAPDSARLVSRLLSGYLCGTHSGLLAFSASGRQLRARRAATISSMHKRFSPRRAGEEVVVGERLWRSEEQGPLAATLRSALSFPGVLDLVFFGSQARGERTGFSDVDAILVVTDDAAESAERLRALRPHVLAAQRAVLRYQPMQHHGFEVLTPRLLALACLPLPREALSETCSLRGASLGATTQNCDRAGERLVALSASLTSADSWPTHPWQAHRLVAMFELLPTLYLQARGMSVPKWRSFALARDEFGQAWWPYDVLEEVRLLWPRERRRELELGVAISRNPWAAVAAWRRLPGRLPQ